MTNAGHANEYIGNAIKNQIDSSMFFSFLYDTKIRNNLTNKILEISPKHFDKVVLASTGTEATDLAYKLIKYWSKNDIDYLCSILSTNFYFTINKEGNNYCRLTLN